MELCCRICGEVKNAIEFHNILNFTKYKKHKVQWCKTCQKMYVDHKKEQIHHMKLEKLPRIFTVSFD